MTIRKGEAWGEPGRLPPGARVARSDAEAAAALAGAPVVGLRGGDLFTTLGGRAGNVTALATGEGVAFPIDLGDVEVNGEHHSFAAHAIAHSRLWTTTVAVMNAQWIGAWNVAPRAHPNDGLLDVVEAHLTLGDLRKVRARLRTGAHLPHPRIRERRVASLEITLPRPLPVWVDGTRVAGRATSLRVTIRPDAARVVV